MTELWTLLRVELRALYGINKFRYTKDAKEKRKFRGMLVAWALLIAMAFSYVGGLAFGLCSLGLADIVPAYLVTIASLLVLVFSIFSAGSKVFGTKGYDILASMPIRSYTIVLSRFLSMYIGDLLFAAVIMLPGTAVYGICIRPDFGFYLTALLGTLMIPAIPLVISLLFGTLLMAVSSRMKSKSLIQSVLSVGIVIGVMTASFSAERIAENVTLEQLSNLAQTVGSIIGSIYPPAMWMSSAMTHGSIAGLALYFLVSAAVMAFAVAFVSCYFHAIQHRLLSFSAKHDYQIKHTQSRSMLKALYVREAKRYFSSSIYVTNTIIGPILGTVMAVVLCITGLDTLQSQLMGFDVNTVLPFVFAAVFCMMPTTSVAISMEGSQFWVVQSLPIPSKTLLDSKLLLNLSLMLPFYVVSAVTMVIVTNASGLQLLWLLLVPALMMLFSTVLGITVNLKLHSFEWENEAAVVKQSASAALGGFAGLLISAVLGVAVFLVPAQYTSAVTGLECLLLLGVTALLYKHNNKAVLSAL